MISVYCPACDPRSPVDWNSTRLNLTAYADEINQSAATWGVDPALVRAIVHAESAFNPQAESRKGAQLAVLILFAQFWELYVMVAPAMGHGHEAAHAHLPVVEFAATLGFLGLFTLVFGWALARHDAVPLKDPELMECLEYHS